MSKDITDSERQRLREQFWEKLKEAAEIATDAKLFRINEGIQLLLEVISSRAKEEKRLRESGFVKGDGEKRPIN